jgi:hypothetical protein
LAGGRRAFTKSWDEGSGIILAMMLSQKPHELASLDGESRMDHPPTVAPADFHKLLHAFLGSSGQQRRKLAQVALVADPDLTPCRYHVLGTRVDRLLF